MLTIGCIRTSGSFPLVCNITHVRIYEKNFFEIFGSVCGSNYFRLFFYNVQFGAEVILVSWEPLPKYTSIDIKSLWSAFKTLRKFFNFLTLGTPYVAATKVLIFFFIPHLDTSGLLMDALDRGRLWKGTWRGEDEAIRRGENEAIRGGEDEVIRGG